MPAAKKCGLWHVDIKEMKMKKIEIMETVALSSPHLFGLLVTRSEDGRRNVMGVSWFSFASLKPAKMVFCLGSKGYTGEVIGKTGVATLCLPTEQIEKKAMACCKSSGRDTDKIASLGLETILPEGFDVPAIVGSRIAWALKLDQTMQAGDHTVFLADITAAAQLSDEPSLYAFGGYSELKSVE